MPKHACGPASRGSAVKLSTPDAREQPPEVPRRDPEPRSLRVLGVPHPDHTVKPSHLDAHIVVAATTVRALAPLDHLQA